MQSAAHWEVVRSGAGSEGGRERGQPLAAELVEWKRQAHYWRSQHRRAKERIAGWQAKWQAVKQELAEAQGEIQGLRQQVAVLQQENEGLRRENKELLQSPFKKRSEKSEKSPSAGEDGGDGGEGEPGSEPAAGGSPGGKRRRGGQPGGAPHPRVDRSGLEVRDEVREPAGGCACPDCGRPYSRNGEEVSERIEVEVKGHVRRIRRPRYRATCECPPPPDRAGAEVIAPLEPALCRGTSYGLSVWVTWLIQVYWQRRPARAFEREWCSETSCCSSGCKSRRRNSQFAAVVISGRHAGRPGDLKARKYKPGEATRRNAAAVWSARGASNQEGRSESERIKRRKSNAARS